MAFYVAALCICTIYCLVNMYILKMMYMLLAIVINVRIEINFKQTHKLKSSYGGLTPNYSCYLII